MRLPHFILIAAVIVAAYLVWRNRERIVATFRG